MPCREGMLGIEIDDTKPNRAVGLLFAPAAVLADLGAYLQVVQTEVDRHGGVQPYQSGTYPLTV